MGIQLLSISHKTAPLAIRELFAFTSEQQTELLKSLCQEAKALESVVISTCNRTEIYTYDTKEEQQQKLFSRIQRVVLEKAGALKVEHITDYLRFYQGEKAVRHLFLVAAGLDSMVVGEDQILGQVKKAHDQAREAGTTGKYLNTLFRYAVTCAKRIKTDTELSKTSVSTATLAIKAAEEALGGLAGKRIMVIGGTGEIGGIVLKNLYSMKGLSIYTTIRNITLSHDAHLKSESSQVIDYKERYSYVDEMDVIISATSSPHYTLTYHKLRERIHTEKSRVFVDLAVPVDIEEAVTEIPRTFLYNMDDMEALAKANNQAKKQAAKEAGEILKEYEDEFMCWMIFQQAMPQIEKTKEWMLKEAEKKGFSRAIDKLFYRLREQASPGELEAIFRCLEESKT
ncbi:MAG: glutamyl-tRNA reductase [Lachnospiraceae bacterium]|jgi:glutamyl-tRNA reductase|nr:glutamyl-tRNA reductase [Lachnospiraceae bacterium]